MKTLNRLLRVIESAATMVFGSFMGVTIAAVGMHSIILGITSVILACETGILFYACWMIMDKIKKIKERRF